VTPATGARDLYAVLGVNRNAGAEEIRGAYKRLALEHHPDRNAGDPTAAERFREINAAYQVLSNPEKRDRYDRYGEQGLGGSDAADFNFGGVQDIFDLFMGGRQQADPRAGSDLLLRLEVTLEEIETGTEKRVSVTRQKSCETCNGTGSRSDKGRQPCAACAGAGRIRTAKQSMLFGSVVQEVTCYRCGGRGQIVTDPCQGCSGAGVKRKREELTVRVEPGMEHGMRMRMRGEGESGPLGGPPGDLYVELHVAPHPRFRRQGADLITEVNVSLSRAALGGSVKLQTLSGEQVIQIPAGAQPGDLFRCRGLGLPRFRSSGRGDLHVMIKVEIPRRLNERQRQALLDLAAAGDEDLELDASTRSKNEGGLLEWVRNLISARDDRE